jgi:hypothetical protein
MGDFYHFILLFNSFTMILSPLFFDAFVMELIRILGIILSLVTRILDANSREIKALVRN